MDTDQQLFQTFLVKLISQTGRSKESVEQIKKSETLSSMGLAAAKVGEQVQVDLKVAFMKSAKKALFELFNLEPQELPGKTSQLEIKSREPFSLKAGDVVYDENQARVGIIAANVNVRVDYTGRVRFYSKLGATYRIPNETKLINSLGEVIAKTTREVVINPEDHSYYAKGSLTLTTSFTCVIPKGQEVVDRKTKYTVGEVTETISIYVDSNTKKEEVKEIPIRITENHWKKNYRWSWKDIHFKAGTLTLKNLPKAEKADLSLDATGRISEGQCTNKKNMPAQYSYIPFKTLHSFQKTPKDIFQFPLRLDLGGKSLNELLYIDHYEWNVSTCRNVVSFVLDQNHTKEIGSNTLTCVLPENVKANSVEFNNYKII